MAAMAGLQPLGNTLATARVVTKAPFLLKGQLREYQQIGLDWLVTLYQKRLNGEELGFTPQGSCHMKQLVMLWRLWLGLGGLVWAAVVTLDQKKRAQSW